MNGPDGKSSGHMSTPRRLEGKKVLISGGAGYLGANLAARLQDTDCHVVLLSRSVVPAGPTGRARVETLQGDVRETATWDRALEGVDIVFHLAAQTSVYVANRDPSSDLKSNVVPMLHLLEVCLRQNLHPSIVFAGTVTEVGLPKHLPVDEGAGDLPVTIYDIHKWMAENYLKLYARMGMVRGTALRLANVYGPGPRSSSADRGILNQMIRKALKGETLTVYGAGQHIRDYVFVGDVVEAFLAAADRIEQVNGRHFVIGSGQGFRIVEAFEMVAERVAGRTGKRVPVVSVEPPSALSPIEDRNFVADTSAFTEATGWRPAVPLAEGIDRTIDACLADADSRT